MGSVRAAWWLAGVVLLAGCASVTGSRPTTPAPVTTSPAASVGPAAHALGQAVDADHSFLEVTVYAFQQPVANGAPAPNPGEYTWAAADAKTCASTSSIFSASVTSLSWSLVYTDQSEVGATRVTYPQFPQPVYPIDQVKLKPGQCIRGWIVFGVPAGTKPVVIRYAPYGATPVDWNPEQGS